MEKVLLIGAHLKSSKTDPSESRESLNELERLVETAGGHVVALVGSDDALHTQRGMNPDAVRGYLSLSAIWDIQEMSAAQDRTFQERVTYPVFGRDPARWGAYSPLTKLTTAP